MATDPALDQIESAIADRVGRGKPLKVMYGETYDSFGPTLDSLKYYFTVAAIGKALRAQSAEVSPAILVADVAVCRNEPEDRHAAIMHRGARRAELVRAVSEHYCLDLDVVLMSEYLHTDSFQEFLGNIRSKAEERPEIYRWLKKTVPPSKVEIEEKKGFAYAFEEIATILDYDLKVGPPREKFYDQPSRMIGESLGYDSLLSVYLHPTYPLGLDFDFFFANEEIEEYGVTAYKAGSKGLDDHRIVLDRTTADRLRRLVEKSFIPAKPGLPNPVLDLAVIAEMAEHLSAGSSDEIRITQLFYSKQITAKELTEKVCEDVPRYILDPLRSMAQGATQE